MVIALQAFHKTGVFLITDMMMLAATTFGFNSTDSFVGRTFFDMYDVCMSKHLQCSHLRQPQHKIVFFRHPRHHLVSGYLYHKAGKETWTLDVAKDNPDHSLDTFWTKTQSTANPMRQGDSLSSYLQRIDEASGLSMQLLFDQVHVIPKMRVGYAACERPRCERVCLEWFMEDPETAWRAAIHGRVSQTHEDMFIRALRSYRPNSHHKTNSTDHTSLLRTVSRLDKHFTSLPWTKLCA